MNTTDPSNTNGETALSQKTGSASDKFCITCNQSGHTYLECSRCNFFDLLGATFGVPSLITGETSGELQTRVADELRELREQNNGSETRRKLEPQQDGR